MSSLHSTCTCYSPDFYQMFLKLPHGMMNLSISKAVATKQPKVIEELTYLHTLCVNAGRVITNKHIVVYV